MVTFEFTGSTNFRLRIVCSMLSQKRVRISNIKNGIEEHEMSFIRMVEKISNGAIITVDPTGTTLSFTPGTLVGGTFSHNCSVTRSLGYYLFPLAMLAPFTKNPILATLIGVTNGDDSISVDIFRSATLPYLSRFIGTEEGLDLRVLARGCPPLGGGKVEFRCPRVATLNTISLVLPGKIRRIRGLAHTCRVPPSHAMRIAYSAKEILLPFLNDIYIEIDHRREKQAGLSPGFGVALIAETTNGMLYTSQICGKGGDVPEDVGKTCAQFLLNQILESGCCGTETQPFILLLMCLCSENVSTVYFGKLSTQAVEALRLFKDFFGVTFRVTVEPENKLVKLSCFGVGYKNLSRKVY